MPRFLAPRFFAHAPLAVVLAAALSMPSPALASVVGPASTPEQLAYAKQLYGEGLAALEIEDYVTATSKFELAYVYAPDKHVFNFNIGSSAHAAGDCMKAKTAFQRFLDLVPDHPERGAAQRKLLDIEQSGCANVAVVPSAGGARGAGDAPDLVSHRQMRQDAADAELEAAEKKRETKYKFNKHMKIGIALGGVGAVGLVTGGVGWMISGIKKRKLDGLLEKGPTGYPPGNYADADVFKADKTRRRAAIAAFVGAGVGVLAGGAGAVVYMMGLKKCRAEQGTAPQARQGHPAGIGPALLPGGAGVAAAGHFGRTGRGRSVISFGRCD